MLRRRSGNALAPGKIQDHGVKERRVLLDDYLPEFDVRTSYATRVAASPARVYASLWTANFDHWRVTPTPFPPRTPPPLPARAPVTLAPFPAARFRERVSSDGLL